MDEFIKMLEEEKLLSMVKEIYETSDDSEVSHEAAKLMILVCAASKDKLRQSLTKNAYDMFLDAVLDKLERNGREVS